MHWLIVVLFAGVISGCATADLRAPSFSASMPTPSRSYQQTYSDGLNEWMYFFAEYSPGSMMEQQPTATILVFREKGINPGNFDRYIGYSGLEDLFGKNLRAFHEKQKMYRKNRALIIRRDVFYGGDTYRIGVWFLEKKYIEEFGDSDVFVRDLWNSISDFDAALLSANQTEIYTEPNK